MSVNNFGIPIKKVGNYNSIDSMSKPRVISLVQNELSTHLLVVDEKYLDKTEADKLYIHYPITGDINMNNKRITNIALPTKSYDVVNKKYVDDTCKKVQDKFVLKETFLAHLSDQEKKTNIPMDSPVCKMFQYYDLILKHKPVYWLSSRFHYGLFYQPAKPMLRDLLGNDIEIVSSFPTTIENAKSKIYGIDIKHYSKDEITDFPVFEFLFNSKLFINHFFRKNFTFIMIARKDKEQGNGSLISSIFSDRYFGWRDNAFTMHLKGDVVSEDSIGTPNPLTQINYFAVRNDGHVAGHNVEFYYQDKVKKFRSTSEFGRMKVGEAGKGFLYELILFEYALKDDDLKFFKTFLIQEYSISITSTVQNNNSLWIPKPKVVNKKILENLN